VDDETVPQSEGAPTSVYDGMNMNNGGLKRGGALIPPDREMRRGEPPKKTVVYDSASEGSSPRRELRNLTGLGRPHRIVDAH
jgi:hypothetical protein